MEWLGFGTGDRLGSIGTAGAIGNEAYAQSMEASFAAPATAAPNPTKMKAKGTAQPVALPIFWRRPDRESGRQSGAKALTWRLRGPKHASTRTRNRGCLSSCEP